MKIGIVLYPYGEENPGGLARTIYEWTQALIALDRGNEYIVYLKNKPTTMPAFPGTNWSVEIVGGGFFWHEMLRFKRRADVYLFQTAILPLTFSPPSAIIIQDFPYLYLKPPSLSMRVLWYVVRLYHHFSIARADALIAVSEATRKDLIQFFGADSKKITRVYMGFKSICNVPESAIDLPMHFFFYSGVIKERKNVLNSIKAYAACLKENPLLKEDFVLAGRKGGAYYEEIRKYIRKEGIESRVLFVNHIPDAEQSYAYKRATALIFPSVVESFGFPVLEAMDCGTPVITSNFGGPSETGADGAAVLINPRSPESIAEAMFRVSTDEPWRRALIEKGQARAKEFSWEKTARESLVVLNQVAKK